MNLTSDLISGEVKVGVLDSLPVPGVDLLIGNDLMGAKVGVDPIVTVSPESSISTERLEDDFPGIFPSCAVTRSMSKGISSKTSSLNDSIYDLSGTFMDHSFHEVEAKHLSSKGCNFQVFLISQIVCRCQVVITFFRESSLLVRRVRMLSCRS